MSCKKSIKTQGTVIKSNKHVFLAFIIMSVILCLTIFYSIGAGSLQVTWGQLFNGLFFNYDETVAAIFDLRFPRIFIAVLAGAALAVSGGLLQAVLRNPLADPGIIGVSGGAQLVSQVILFVAPQLFFFTPLFAFMGGALGFILVYILAGRGNSQPLKILLIGVAINAMFAGFVQALNYMSGQILGGAPGLSVVNIGMKGWSDFTLLMYYVPFGLVISFLVARLCNLLLLEEQTVQSLGIRVGRVRLIISFVAVLLASMATSVVGVISFLALIVPHVSRAIVGSDHRKSLPFAAMIGAFTFLICDTLGRTLLSPIEIPAGILMAVIGGPLFVILLRKGGRVSHG